MLRKPQPVMPVMPRLHIELPNLGLSDHLTQIIITDALNEGLHIVIIAYIHYLGDDESREFNSLFRRFPPDVSFSQAFQKFKIKLTHNSSYLSPRAFLSKQEQGNRVSRKYLD